MAKNDNPENENLNEGNSSDDNFGLPDLEYKPLENSEESANESDSVDESKEETTETPFKSEKSKEYSYTAAEEPSSKAPVIIAIIIGLVVVVAAFLIYQYVYKPKAEKARLEQLAKAEEAKRKQKEADELAAREKEEAERKRLEAEQAAANAKPAEGAIETLTARTGRYYVVVTSAIDGDLTMDYAKKLSATGVSVRIIPPYGKYKFHRLTIGDYGTFAEAQTNADAVKPTYGNAVWVIKY